MRPAGSPARGEPARESGEESPRSSRDNPSARQVRPRYLILHGLRWLPAGLLIPILVLLMQERGLTLTQIGLAVAAQGVLVLALELPTGGFADALGRKPVLVVASVVNLASVALLVVANSFCPSVAVWALQGVFRALDSGPLESWYVDSTLAADPDAAYEKGLGQGGTVLGLGVAAGPCSAAAWWPSARWPAQRPHRARGGGRVPGGRPGGAADLLAETRRPGRRAAGLDPRRPAW